MKKFNIRKGNFIKDNNTTYNLMYSIVLVLIPLIIFSIYKNGIYPTIKGEGSLYLVFKPLIFILISSVLGTLVEYIYYKIKKKDKTVLSLLVEDYSIIPGIFISLVIPINTPIWLLAVGSIISSLSKVVMGGIGKNRLNPALVGAFFIIIIFQSYTGGYLNPYELDTVSSATPLTNVTASGYVITYDNLVKPYGSLLNFFIGNIPGAVGETSSLLCILAFIYLTYKKVIKYRITISYILTVAVMSLIICLTKDIGLWFILFNILSGGLLFGAVFMATDPVTSPITNRGQVLGGIFLGVSTLIIRYLTPLPEGVLVSILLFNILTIVINYLDIKLYDKKICQDIILIIFLVLVVLISFMISTKLSTKPLDDTYKIISKVKEGDITTYEVSGKGYAGNNSIKLKIVFKDKDITSIEVLRSDETYTKMIYDNDYLTKLKDNSKSLDNLDTISGCTYTSRYLKDIVSKTINDYNS